MLCYTKYIPRKEVTPMSTSKKLRSYPYFVGILSIISLAALMQAFAIVDCFFPAISYEIDAVSAVMSTCAEVLAGLYGITLTGYIFFSDRFQNTAKEDESLYDAVQALLLRYNHMAGCISLMCLVCIVLGEGIVLYGNNTLLIEGLHRFWINETLLLYFLTFDLILYFVISVLDPHKVSRISSQRKAKLSEDTAVGDPEKFLEDWAAIEEKLQALREKLIRDVRLVPGAGKNKPQIVHTLEILRNYGRISSGLWRKLDKLRQYHNLTLHDPGMIVSQEMCDLAKETRGELETKK